MRLSEARALNVGDRVETRVDTRSSGQVYVRGTIINPPWWDDAHPITQLDWRHVKLDADVDLYETGLLPETDLYVHAMRKLSLLEIIAEAAK